MHFEQFYLGCLAHASYMLGSEGEAAVVDPQRDVELYLTAAAEKGLKIKHIFETHLHADFVSGHVELARRTGATIYIGARAGAEFPHVPLSDGFELRMGKVRIAAVETPGHTPESCCLVITNLEARKGADGETAFSAKELPESPKLPKIAKTERQNRTTDDTARTDQNDGGGDRGRAAIGEREKPWAVLTGDTLFIGDVGRPDLSPGFSSQQLAGMLYDSLHSKLLMLPDDVLVYPAHGAGSLCGRNMRADRFSTIGTERMTNYALQINGRDEFIRQMTANLPARPEYFFQDAQINRQGAAPLGDLPPLKAISAAELKRLLDEDVFALDVRPVGEFADAHVPRSINIALSGQFATWSASVLGLQSSPVLIADTPQQYEEARVRMARVGIEDVRGYLDGGLAAWKQAGFALEKLPQITAQELHQSLSEGQDAGGDGTGAGTGNQAKAGKNLRVLDVRREPEWQAGHIAGAAWWPLDRFKVSPPELDPGAPLAVHCASGYRSVIACSLLRRAGMQNVINVVGGFDAWKKAGLEVEKAEAAAVS
jgi:glyoxylase-like metal-dependent hydrolase (beta-lactamase superfamily II)/rhodanese-related sulfurtransferase